MGLNCGCPGAASLPDITIPECKESLGQIQKVIFQRIFKEDGSKNSVATPNTKAVMTPFFAAEDSTRMVVSPYLQNPTSEPGAARTFGGGNQTLGGIEVIIGREPTTFTAVLYQEAQSVIKAMKALMCEKHLGVWLIDENGNIGALKDDSGEATTYLPIPIGKMFVGDKKLGGFEEPDSNVVEWNFFPNWSDDLVILKQAGGELTFDYNPLTDLVNA